MGAWGMKTFENDTASDWIWDLEESNDTSVLESALKPEEYEGYLEGPDGENALAACEIINGILNNPREGLPDNAIAWITSHSNLDMTPLIPGALKMLKRVLADNSELNELWAENETDYPAWKSGVEELIKLLSN